MKKTILLALAATALAGTAATAAESGVKPMPGVAPTTTQAPTTMPGTTATAPQTTMIFVEYGKPGERLSSKLIGADVYSAGGEKIGDVNDLILDPTGKVSGVVVGVGGFLGVGEKDVALAWSAMTLGAEQNGDPRLTTPVTKEALKTAAAYTPPKTGIN